MDNTFENFWLNGGAKRGINERKKQEELGGVLRDMIQGYTIDSCDTFDEGYETAIWYENNKMVIVERYDTREEMKNGHKRWCEFCKTNPNEVFSVQLDKVVNLKQEREYGLSR